MEPVRCYNRGCGKTFVDDPDAGGRSDKECLFHPGAPFFHDAYKGWTCCDRKATDFTEFLNFPGCTKGMHSSVKPVEPESITGNLTKVDDDLQVKVETRKPITSKPRPGFNTPLVKLKPTLAKSLKDELEKNPLKKESEDGEKESGIKVGEPCKNGGCKVSYTGDVSSDNSECQFHSGVPIFHEGLKFWSCCQRRTTDFQAFLDQVGCTRGEHCWIKKQEGGSKTVACRYDWHQVAEKVTMAIYCKKYDPDSTSIEISPVRLKVHIFFPEQGGSFDLDLHLAGIVNLDKTTVTMYGSKIELQLYKAEAGSWGRLDIAKPPEAQVQSDTPKVQKEPEPKVPVDTLDLDDLEIVSPSLTLSPEALTQPKYLNKN